MKQINSECGKFRVEIKNDDDSELQICRKITSSEGTKEYKVTKYRTIKIMNSYPIIMILILPLKYYKMVHTTKYMSYIYKAKE